MKSSRILEEALALSDRERAELACELLESLSPDDDDLLDAAWADELDHRLAEWRRGEGETVTWSTLKQER